MARVADLFGWSRTEIDTFGLGHCFQSLLAEHGIPESQAPLQYALSVFGYGQAAEYDDEVDIRELPKADQAEYIGLFFTGETFSEDIGGELEEAERNHPGLGRAILQLLEESPCNLLTPRVMWEDAEYLLNWQIDKGGWKSSGNDLAEITPEEFRKYYPRWAYEQTDENGLDGLNGWDGLTALRESIRAWDETVSEIRRRGFVRSFIQPNGCDMFVGCITWTKGRNEIERDIGYRVCDDVFHQFQYASGANPGCVQFEFILTDAYQTRNRLMVKLLADFIDHLAALNDVLDDIEKGAFR